MRAECVTGHDFLTTAQVNESRLADDETRVLCNGDVVTFTPFPFDDRPSLPWKGQYRKYPDHLFGGPFAIRSVYTEYKMDDLRTLSPVGRVVRRSLAELERVRKAVQDIRTTRCVALSDTSSSS